MSEVVSRLAITDAEAEVVVPQQPADLQRRLRRGDDQPAQVGVRAGQLAGQQRALRPNDSIAAVSAAWVASTVRPSPMSLLVCGRSSVGGVSERAAVVQQRLQVRPLPVERLAELGHQRPQRLLAVPTSTRLLTLVSRLVTGGGTWVSCSGITEPSVR